MKTKLKKILINGIIIFIAVVTILGLSGIVFVVNE